jgi:outer membrane protein assembly factor BamB
MRPFIFVSLLCLGMLGCKKNLQSNIANSPEILWKVPLSKGEETLSIDPIIYKNLVIYSANDSTIRKSKLIAFNKETGKREWEWINRNELSGRIRGSDSYLYNNILVLPILGKPYQVVGLNLDNGTQVWHHMSPEAVGWQLVGAGKWVFHIRSNFDRMKDEIFAADVHTGNWQSVYTASNGNAPTYIQGMHTSQTTDGKKYLTFLVAKYSDFQFSETKSTIFRYSIDSNKMVYEKGLDSLPKTSKPFLEAVAFGKLWLRDNPVRVLDESNAAKHSELFCPPTAGTTAGKIALAGTNLLMTTVNKLVCFDARTGTFLWQEAGNTSGSASRILYYNKVIYYTSGGTGHFHALDATTGQSIYNEKSPDEKPNGQGTFDSAITLDTVNKRIYTASYLSAICYKMPN